MKGPISIKTIYHYLWPCLIKLSQTLSFLCKGQALWLNFWYWKLIQPANDCLFQCTNLSKWLRAASICISQPIQKYTEWYIAPSKISIFFVRNFASFDSRWWTCYYTHACFKRDKSVTRRTKQISRSCCKTDIWIGVTLSLLVDWGNIFYHDMYFRISRCAAHLCLPLSSQVARLPGHSTIKTTLGTSRTISEPAPSWLQKSNTDFWPTIDPGVSKGKYKRALILNGGVNAFR